MFSLQQSNMKNLFISLQKKKSLYPDKIEILLVCGIANPQPLTDYIHESTKTYDALFYSDHHIYTVENLNEIEERYSQIRDDQKMIITTEKDAVRLIKFKDRIAHLPLYVLPISIGFLFGQEDDFKSLISSYPKRFYDLHHLELLSEQPISE